MASSAGSRSTSTIQIGSTTSIISNKKSGTSIHKPMGASDISLVRQKDGGDEEKKKSNVDVEKKKSSHGRGKFGKNFKPDTMRVKLTPIEEYERKLIFHLDNDAPARVVSRLERLMGSDKVQLMDHDWMRSLENRLDAEDEKEWVKRNHLRMKAEQQRYRKLAIDGYIPVPDTPDMQDIYKHPIYRVNKIIKRLGKFDYNALINPKLKMPPLTLINPFEDDPSGKSFKSWPGHNVAIDELERGISNQGAVFPRLSASPASKHDHIAETKFEPIVEPVMTPVDIPQEQPVQYDEFENEETTDENTELEPVVSSKAEDEEDEEEEDETDEEIEEKILAFDKTSAESLDGVRRDLKQWEPFQAKLLKMFDQLNSESELFKVGDDIVGVYNREVLEAEEACIHLNKVINAHANNLEIPVNVKTQQTAEEAIPPTVEESVQSTNVDSESVSEEVVPKKKSSPPPPEQAK